MGEMDNLKLSGGKKRNSAPKRQGPIGALDKRRALRQTFKRRSLKLRRSFRRLRGIDIFNEEEEEVSEEELKENNRNGSSGKPINELDSDDNDDFLDPNESIDFSTNNGDDGNNAKKDEKEENPSTHEKIHGTGSEEDDGGGDGHWGRYDDEYENTESNDSVINKKGDSLLNKKGDSLLKDVEGSHRESHGGSYRDGGGEDFSDNNTAGGYKDDQQDKLSPLPAKKATTKRRSSFGRRSGLLRQLSNTFRRPVSRRNSGRKSTSNLDHTNLLVGSNHSADNNVSGRRATWSPASPAKGRIEGFGNTPPDFTSPRTLRQKLKDFRENRINAARNKQNNDDDGMQKMDVIGGEDDDDPGQKKNWKERIDNVVNAMVDASLPEHELKGYMTSPSQTDTTPQHHTKSTTPNNTPMSTTDASKMSYLRKQFGDDNAYIVYLEGEKIAHELEALSHQNRIKELEAETRRLRGMEGKENDLDNNGVGGNTSVASDSSHVAEGEAGAKKSEWQTGVPEEGVLIDLDGTTTADQEIPAKLINLPLQLPLTEETEETGPQANTTTTAQSTEPLPTPPAEQIQEMPDDINGTKTTEQCESVLVDLTARDTARDIVDSILADVLNEKKATSPVGEDQNKQEESLLTLKLGPSSGQAESTIPASESNDGVTPVGQGDTTSAPAEALSGPPSDAPPEAPVDTLSDLIDPPANAPLETPADTSLEIPADVPPKPPADPPPEPPVELPPQPVDAPPVPPADAPPEPPADTIPDLKDPTTDAPVKKPADTSLEIPADVPPKPPTDPPPEPPAELPPQPGEALSGPPTDAPPEAATTETAEVLKETSTTIDTAKETQVMPSTTMVGTDSEAMESKPTEMTQNSASTECSCNVTEPSVKPEAPLIET